MCSECPGKMVRWMSYDFDGDGNEGFWPLLDLNLLPSPEKVNFGTDFSLNFFFFGTKFCARCVVQPKSGFRVQGSGSKRRSLRMFSAWAT